MAGIAYKGFRVYYVDPTTLEPLQYAETFEWPICNINPDTGSFPFSLTNPPVSYETARVLLAGTQGGWSYQDLSGFILPRYEQNNPSAMLTAIDNVLFVVPKARANVKNETGQACKVKIVGTNGYYAISQVTIANNEYGFGTSSAPLLMDLYDDSNNLVYGSSRLGALAYYINSTEIVFQYNFNGTVTAGGVLHGLIMGSTTEPGKVTLLRYQPNENYTYTQAEADWINALTPLPPPVTDPYDPGGNSEPSDNSDAPFDRTGEDIDFPVTPTLSPVDAGFITLYNPTLYQLNNLAHYMWDGSVFDISTWQKLFADPMDAILGLSIVPVTVPHGQSIPVKIGNIATTVSMNIATTQYVTVDCGSLIIGEYWGAYLDYAPYTKIELYLPYCGTHPLDVDDVMGKTVTIQYKVDILSGACVAFVKCGGSVLYTFTGQCSQAVPISGRDFTNIINNALSFATAGLSMIASGGLTAPTSIPQMASSAINAVKPSIEKSNAVGGAGGMLSIQKPYVIITFPRQSHPFNQNKFTGFPLNTTEILGDLSGYTEVETIHLDAIPATSAEIDEIEQLLKQGVIL